MWNDRAARSPVVGELDKLEEMDVCLSLREFRDFLDAFGDTEHTARLIGGSYVLEPWVRIRMSDDWILTAGIEVTRDDEDGA